MPDSPDFPSTTDRVKKGGDEELAQSDSEHSAARTQSVSPSPSPRSPSKRRRRSCDSPQRADSSTPPPRRNSERGCKRKAARSPPPLSGVSFLESLLSPWCPSARSPLFASSLVLASGTSPFPWVNTVDASSPLTYLHRDRNAFHFSARQQPDLLGPMDWTRPGAEADDSCCDCDEDSRCDAESCACAQQSQCQYVKGKSQLDVAATGTPAWITECNARCRCAAFAPPCHNRVVQAGPLGPHIQPLVFHTGDRGWGVLTQTAIPARQYVCEYVGEWISDQHAETRRDGFFFTVYENDVTAGRFDIEAPTLDARYYGHVARFINHSCAPNLVVHHVQVEGRNPLQPHFALFAAQRRIEKGEELTIDYAYGQDVRERTFGGHCRCTACKRPAARSLGAER